MPVELPVTVHVRDDASALYIGRAYTGRGYWLFQSVWANPYIIGKDVLHPMDGDRATVLAKYEAYVRRTPSLMKLLPTLAGRRLGCWCAKHGQTLTADDPLVCHGQVLARLLREVNDASAIETLKRIPVLNDPIIHEMLESVEEAFGSPDSDSRAVEVNDAEGSDRSHVGDDGR